MTRPVAEATISIVSMKLHPQISSCGGESVVRIDLVGGIAGHTCNEGSALVRSVTDLDIIKAVFINDAIV